MNRIKFLGTIFAFSLLILGLPSIASAQWRNDDYYGNNRNNNNRRYLTDAVRRVEQNSRSFRRALDRELDNSRYDTSRREDRINDTTERFATAADNLEDSFDNAQNIRSSNDEARQLLQLGSQIDRFMSRQSLGSNVENQWSNIRRDLQTIANAYNLSFNGNGSRGGRNRDYDDDDDDWNRGRNRDDRRNDRRNNGRGNRFPF